MSEQLIIRCQTERRPIWP